MIPNNEPNALPQPYDDWKEWRASYAMYVDDFKGSSRGMLDRLRLEQRLKRLGFVGVNLSREMTYVKENTHVPGPAR